MEKNKFIKSYILTFIFWLLTSLSITLILRDIVDFFKETPPIDEWLVSFVILGVLVTISMIFSYIFFKALLYFLNSNKEKKTKFVIFMILICLIPDILFFNFLGTRLFHYNFVKAKHLIENVSHEQQLSSEEYLDAVFYLSDDEEVVIIDSNPNDDINDIKLNGYNECAWISIKILNDITEVDPELSNKMQEEMKNPTHQRYTEETSDIKVTWQFDEIKGLEVKYENKHKKKK